ncbi:MAG: thioesterase [Tissierellia bacterium]|nr:thioesterase [Tissierellia bacterium]
MEYTKEFRVPAYMVTADQFITPEYLLKEMVDSSREHSDIALGEEFGSSHFWILMSWVIDIMRMPRLDEKISIRTYVAGYKKFFIYRGFEVTGPNGEQLVHAMTVWTLMDPVARALIRIPKELFPDIDKPEKVHVPLRDFELRPDALLIRDHFLARRSDIDFNEHVNNAVYWRWVYDLVPYDQYKGLSIRRLDAEYKKEILLGDRVLIEGRVFYREERKVFEIRILDETGEELKALLLAEFQV